MATIIATPGASDANSYATLAEANTYHDERLHNAAWTSASDATKISALIWATRVIEDNFLWYSTQKTEDQALHWPAYSGYYKSGYPIPDTVVPQMVKESQSELAFLLIEEDLTVADDPITPGVASAKIGSLSFKSDKTDRKSMLPDSVLVPIQILGEFKGAGTSTSNGTFRTFRV